MKYLKIQQVAELLQVSPARVREYIAVNRLRAVNVSSRPNTRPQWRVHPDDVRDLAPPTAVAVSVRRAYTQYEIDI